MISIIYLVKHIIVASDKEEMYFFHNRTSAAKFLNLKMEELRAEGAYIRNSYYENFVRGLYNPLNLSNFQYQTPIHNGCWSLVAVAEGTLIK